VREGLAASGAGAGIGRRQCSTPGTRPSRTVRSRRQRSRSGSDVGRKNLDRYTPADWRNAGPTVQAVIENRWRVYTECEVCELRMVADLRRIALAKG
jgi:hypothetical protein